MTSHDHHPGSADGAAPGSQPAHPGNATRRAAAVTRQTSATSQAGDFVLLAAAPVCGLLIIITMRAVNELMIALDAALPGASPATAADTSAIVSQAAARTKP